MPLHTMTPNPHAQLSDAELLRLTESFARELVAPRVAHWEAQRRMGRELLAQAGALGLLGMELPVEQGGLGRPFSFKVRVAETLAQVDFAFTMSLLNTGNLSTKLWRDAKPEVARRYLNGLLCGQRVGCTALTEPHAGSDFAAITTTATRVAQGWRLDGRKAWITNATEADVVVLYAQTEPAAGARGVAGFVVDGRREGFIREGGFALGGQHAIGAGGFTLNGYIAQADECIGAPGQAFKMAMNSINGARTYIAAMCCGMVAECLRVAQAYGQQRHSFGQKLAGHQGWRWRLAQASAELAAARLMVRQAAQAIDAGHDAQLMAAQAKLLATQMAERQIPVLAQAMGAEGLREQHPFSRHLLGARVAGFVDGSSEMLLERIAATMGIAAQ